MIVKCNRQHQEAIGEVKIGCTRIVRAAKEGSSFCEKNLAVAVNKTVHPKNAGMVSTVRPKKVGKKLSVFKRDLAEDGTASFSAGYLLILRGGNSPVEAFLAKIFVMDKLIMALTDSGTSLHLISDKYYNQLVEASQVIM